MSRAPIRIPVSNILTLIVVLLLVFCVYRCATAQEDPGPPVIVMDPAKDVQYSLNAADAEPTWSTIAATNVVDSTDPMPSQHKWVHNLRAKPDVRWIGEFPDSGATLHTCRWDVRPTPYLVDTLHQKFWIRWRCRAYVGTPDEIQADWSLPNYIRIVKLAGLTIAFKLN